MIDEELKAVLGELINISFGSATATIADLFDNFATLHVPGITVIPVNELETLVMEGMENEEIYITTQQFKGTFDGEIVFAVDAGSARNMQALICDPEDLRAEDITDEDEIRQSILEIANILGSSCIGKLAELLASEVTFLPPAIEFTRQLLTGLDRTRYTRIIIISTVLEFQEIQVSGKLFILFDNRIYSWLEAALQSFLDTI
jgi:chemotaxis protein CheC